MQPKRTNYKISRRTVIFSCLPFAAALILRYISFRFFKNGLDVALSNWIGLVLLLYLFALTGTLVVKRIKFDRDNDHRA
jgi:hypothetical protein